mgnify:FL=1
MRYHMTRAMRNAAVFPLLALMGLATTALGWDPPDTLWCDTLDYCQRDEVVSVLATSDGGFIMAGFTRESEGHEYFYEPYLMKIASDGGLVWRRTYPDSSLDYTDASVVEYAPGGGFLIGGCALDPASEYDDIRAIRTDSDGNELWDVIMGDSLSDWCYDLVATADGGYAFVALYGIWPGNTDMQLIKTDSLCNIEWVQRYGGSFEDCAFDVKQTADGGFLLSGDTDLGSDNQFYVVKTDDGGEMEWERRWYPSSFQWGRLEDAHQTVDGGCMLLGRASFPSFGVGGGTYLFRLDEEGTLLWEKLLQDRTGYSFLQVGDGGYVIAGRNQTANDTWLARVDSSGNLVWETSLDRYSCRDWATDLCGTQDGGFFAGGETNPGAGLGDLLFVRYASCSGLPQRTASDAGGLLLSARPNPFRSSISVEFCLASASDVRAALYDIAGRKMHGERRPELSEGTHSMEWELAEELPAGYYLLVLEACGRTESRGCVRL